MAAGFASILFDEPPGGTAIDGRTAPEFFTDLNLDQIIAAITAGREEYNLKPFFYVPLSRVEAITYRYEILRDLENRELFGHIGTFARKMRAMRSHLAHAEKMHYPRQKQRWFLEAVDVYCDAVSGLARDVEPMDLRSRGFAALRGYLEAYTESPGFGALLAETRKLKTDLAGIRYCLQIRGSRIKVSRYQGEPDYGAEVLRTFEKFKQGAAKEHRFDFSATADMNHVEAGILELVARLYPDILSSLDQFGGRHGDYLDATIGVFDREIQFYVACHEYAERFNAGGLRMCHPTVSDSSKEIHGQGIFDLALANTLLPDNRPVVTNDFHLQDPERILVVSGPNQGGKTTFARTFGQLHYLASIGCPVPASEALLFLFDKLFTHFERQEDLRNLSSKLENDLLRIHAILEEATSRSILIMNESFASTTLNDALFLSKRVMQRIIQRDMLCVTVTFLDELASLGATTVSMVSTLDPDDPAVRTFHVVRKAADGLAHAVAIARKYRLTYESVKERIGP